MHSDDLKLIAKQISQSLSKWRDLNNSLHQLLVLFHIPSWLAMSSPLGQIEPQPKDKTAHGMCQVWFLALTIVDLSRLTRSDVA
jgi:hypothetical protein